ncbi:glycosyltransferase [Flaviaesturariibacter amylovorans]|uniref:Glycosyltransferase n=1 Tax=Flaviaesturariibacter amylovorans TaxID=1084520 RepID=A0ABP8GFU0_9BACT
MKPPKNTLYLYPISAEGHRPGSNDYMVRLRDCLDRHYRVVNKGTSLGMADLLLKLPRYDRVYFNWIEDVPDRRFGYLQIPMLLTVLLACKLSRKKIVWFVHNNLSHYKTNRVAKRIVRVLMRSFADVTLSHSREIGGLQRLRNLHCFDHPVERAPLLPQPAAPDWDLLIWGTVSPYKGVDRFAAFAARQPSLQALRVLIAGRFADAGLEQRIRSQAPGGWEIRGHTVADEELRDFYARSRYVLFCYAPGSVLSSAALCHSLAHGKVVIGPHTGCFKELGELGLIYTYRSFDELPALIARLNAIEEPVSRAALERYLSANGWEHFERFLVERIG